MMIRCKLMCCYRTAVTAVTLNHLNTDVQLLDDFIFNHPKFSSHCDQQLDTMKNMRARQLSRRFPFRQTDSIHLTINSHCTVIYIMILMIILQPFFHFAETLLHVGDCRCEFSHLERDEDDDWKWMKLLLFLLPSITHNH